MVRRFDMRKKRILLLIGLPLLVALVLVLLFFKPGKTEESSIAVPVTSGPLEITVTTTGELEARRSENIFGPSGLRAVRIWQVKIDDIIPDGTLVGEGDYVATLDRSEISNRIRDEESELEKWRSQYTRTRLDTSLELRNARNELVNLRYALEETKITLEQSKFEPPATIRQVQIELEKAERAYEQAVQNYQLRLDKARASMQEVAASLEQSRRKYEQLMEVLKEFTVVAPRPGMVIYKRNWDGAKQGIGATVSAWDNVVATLPDLSEMISRTFVNEIDISKVQVGQTATVSIDAFPGRKYAGEVIEVANIGEQMRNSNAKVFEVKILLQGSDSILRPAMTTQNVITTRVIEQVLSLPIECVHTEDSVSYVFMAGSRSVRREIRTGEANDMRIIIEDGLKEGAMVLLNRPADVTKYRLEPLATGKAK